MSGATMRNCSRVKADSSIKKELTEVIRYFAATGKVVNDQARRPKTSANATALLSHSLRAVLNRRG
jgi:hypothetical protein